MGYQHRAGRPLTPRDSREEIRRACRACNRVLALRVSGKGYPGQESWRASFDCPACGTQDVVAVWVPDTGGAAIRALSPWARLDERDVDTPVATFVGGAFVLFLGVVAVVGGTHGWFRFGPVLGIARFSAGVVAEGAVLAWSLRRPRVRGWVGGDPARHLVVVALGSLLVAGSLPFLARLLD